MAAEIAVDVTKTFPGRKPIRAGFRYPVEASTVLILFGPSGSGKTTILRSDCRSGVAGGRHDSVSLQSLAGYGRTHQSLAAGPADRLHGAGLCAVPNYSVAGNIAYGLSDLAPADRIQRVQEMVELFHLAGLEAAKPRQLSGGQQQRVALARAVAPAAVAVVG